MSIKCPCLIIPFILLLLPLQATPTKIPFHQVGKLIVVQAKVDGISGNFIVDTGVAQLVLNKKYFSGKPDDRYFKAINGKVGQIEYAYAALHLSSLSWKSLRAEIIPLDALEKVKGIAIHGLIGGQLFRKYRMWLDYDKKAIFLEKATKEANFIPFPDTKKFIVQPFRYKASSPCISLQLGTQSYLFTLDTGAEINVVHQKLKAAFSSTVDLDEKTVLHSFVEGKGHSASTTVYGLKVGGVSCQPMPVVFMNLDKWNRETNDPSVDGILGYDFLRQFRVCIDYKSRKIYLASSEKANSGLLSITKE